MTTEAPDQLSRGAAEADPVALQRLTGRMLDELRLIERLEEHVGKVVFADRLVQEIVQCDERLTRPELPEDGELKALRGYSRPAELVRVAHICRLVQDGDRVLDIGVGRGYVLASLFANAAPSFVHGVDISERLLAQTQLMIDRNGIDRSKVALDTLDVTQMDAGYLTDREIDLVLMFEVLEHVSGPQRALTSIANAMTDHQLLVFSVPIQGRIEACWGHKTLFDVDAILGLVKAAGLHVNWVESVHNMWAVFAVSKSEHRPDVLTRFSSLEPEASSEAPPLVFTPVRRTSSLSGGGYTTVKGCPDVVFDADPDRPCAFGTPGLSALRLELSFEPASAVESVHVECRDVDGVPLAEWDSRRLERFDGVPRSFSFRPGWSDEDFDADILEIDGEIRSTFLTVLTSEPCKVRVHRAHFAPAAESLSLPLAVTAVDR